MVNAVTYLSNVGKSVKYATMDVIKDMNPIVTDMIDTNEDILKTTYSTIKNFKKVTKKSFNSVKDSKITELASEGIKNILEDIKSGNYYNKARMNQYEQDQLDNFAYDDDFSFSFEDNPNSSSSDDEFDLDDLADSIDDVGERSSSAVSQVIMKGAEHTAKVNSTLVTHIMAQNSAMIGAIHSDMSVVNTNLSNLLKFNTDSVQTHIQNSTQFFTRQQEQMTEQISILKELLDVTKTHYGEFETSSSSNKIEIGDLLSSEGSLNISNYIKYVKQNIKDKSSGMGDLISVMMDMGFGKTAIASPFSFLLKGGIKLAIPKVLKEAVAEFNSTLGSTASNILLKLTGLQNNMGISSNIGDIFGLSQKYKYSYDVGQYKKTATSWMGTDHKALTEVIPIYLSKIYSVISGKSEDRYDYEKGQFKSIADIQSEWTARRTRDTMRSHGELADEMVRAIKSQYTDENRRKSIISTLNEVFEDDLRHSRVFNPRQNNIDSKTYSLKGGKKAEENLKILTQIAQRLPNYQTLLMNQANAMVDTISANNREMKRMQENGESVYNSLFNGSMGENPEMESKATPIFDLSISNKFLYNINKEIAYIRELLSINFGNSGKKYKHVRIKKASSKVKDFNSFTFYGDTDTNSDSTKKENANENPINDDIIETQSVDNDAVEESKPTKKKFLDRMIQANSLTDKFKVIFSGINDLVKSPAKLLASMLKKADERVYEMLFGKGKSDDRSFMNKLKDSLNTWLDNMMKMAKDKFNNFSKIFSEKFSSENILNFFSKLKRAFHIDTKGRSFKDFLFGENDDGWGTNIVNMFRKGFSEEKDDVVDVFKSAKDDANKIFGNTIKGEKNIFGKFKEKFNRDTEEKNKDDLKKYKDIADDIGKAATGMRRVDKTGLVAVSEGEMIIPPDDNPYNIKKRSKNEQKAIDKFRSKFGKSGIIGKFASGGTVDSENLENYYHNMSDAQFKDVMYKHRGNADWLAKQLKNPDFKEKYNKFKHTADGKDILKLYRTAAIKMQRNLNRQKKKFSTNDYIEGQEPLLMRMKMDAKNIYHDMKDSFAESETYQDIKSRFKATVKDSEFKNVLNDTTQNFKDYLPRMAAGGVTGAALSGILGIVGGPLVGAAVGISSGLLKNSQKLQSFLFGTEITDDQGNVSMSGGLISSKISTAIHKYAPEMEKGSIIGGLASMLPIVPGGPITGILVGSALGFAKNNDIIREKLFGPNTVLSKMAILVKKKLPRLGLGALAGAVAGPFGIITNLAVGSVLGMATDTERFKDFLFGKKGFDNKRRGGVTGLIKEQFERANLFIRGLISDFRKEFIEKDIIRPLRNFFNPLKQQGINIINILTRQAKEYVWAPIGTYLHRILTSTETVFGKILFGTDKARAKKGSGRAGVVGMLKDVFRFPLVVAGGAGNLLRRHQLQTGGAGDLTAEERLAERKRLFLFNTGKNYRREMLSKIPGLGKLYQNGRYESSNWYNTDKALAEMDASQAKDVAMAARIAALGAKRFGSEKSVKKQIYAIFGKEPLDKLKAHLSNGELSIEQYNKIVTAVKAGNSSVISGYINQTNIPDNYKKVAIKQLVEAAKKIEKETKAVDENFTAYRNNAIETLRKLGITVAGTKKEDLYRIADYADKEAQFKYSDQEAELKEQLEDEKQLKSPMYTAVDQGFDKLFDYMDKILSRLDPEYESSKIISANTEQNTIATLENQDTKLLPDHSHESNNSIIDTATDEKSDDKVSDNLNDFESDSENKIIKFVLTTFDKVLKFFENNKKDDTPSNNKEANNEKAVNKMEESQQSKKAKRIQNQITDAEKEAASTSENNDEENKNEKIVSTADGRLIYYKKDKRGRWVIDTSNSDTRETINEQHSQEDTQKTISGKISELADGFREKFGGKDKEDKKKRNGIFTTLVSSLFGSKIAKTLLLGLGGLATFGFLKSKKITVNQKDSNGNQMYDINGNPIVTEKSLSEIIGDSVKKVWLGSDGTGKTDGIWHGIKEYIPTVMGYVKDGLTTVLTDWMPDLVQSFCRTLPSYIASAIKGLTFSVMDIFKGTKKTTESNTQSNLQETYTTESSDIGSQSLLNSSQIETGNNNTQLTEDLKKKMRSSKAFKNANENVQDKALKSLYGVWDQQTTTGKTVSEVLNDDKTVLTTIRDEDGNSIDITGSNLLQYSSYMPGLSQQILGVDLNLTEEDRDEYTEQNGNRILSGPVQKIKNGMIGVLKQGGTNSKILKYANKVAALPGKAIGKIPVVGKFGKTLWNAAYTTPFKAVGKFNELVTDVRSGETITKGLSKFKTDNVSALKSKLFGATTDTANPTRLQKVGNAVKSAASKVSEKIMGNEKLSKIAKGVQKTVTETTTNSKLAKVFSGIKEFLTDNKVVNKLREALQSLGCSLEGKSLNTIMGDIAEKICTKFIKSSPEKAAQIGAKVAADATVILLIADAIISFTSGMYKADMILKIKKPNILLKVLAGICNALNEVFLFGIIDTGDIFDFIWQILIKLFPSLEESDFQQERDKLTEEVKQYNKEHEGANYTEEEYLKKNKLIYKIWNSRALSPVKGLVNGVGNVASGLLSGAGKLLTLHPIQAVKSVGSGVIDGLKSVGNGIKTLFTGKDSYESEETKKLSKTSTSEKIQEAAATAQDTVEQNADTTQYVYDENGNIVGSGVNADGTIDTMYIPQGESSAAYQQEMAEADSQSIPTQMVSDENTQLLQRASSDINSSIPTLIKSFKTTIANLFGLSTSDSSDNNIDLVSLARAGLRQIAKANPAYLFFKGINTMWKKINKNTESIQEEMPDQMETAATAAANMAQTSILGGSLSDIVYAGADDKKHTLQDTISDLATNTVNNSLGINIFKKGSDLVKKISSGIKKIFTWKTGKGSGLSSQRQEPVIKETQDPTVASFISQKSSEYSSMRFGPASGKESVKDAGCAPASAAMAINANPMANNNLTMPDAIKHAAPYLQEDGGVSADYFADEFTSRGMTPVYITPADKNYKSAIIAQLKNSNTVVLMGTDPSNTSKNKSPFGPTGHYVVAVGISSDERTIYINDPEANSARVPYDIDVVLDASELAIIPTSKNPSVVDSNTIANVKKALQSYTGMATETDTTSASNQKGDWLSGNITKVSSITDALGAFDELAKYYGLSSSSTSTSNNTTSTENSATTNSSTTTTSANSNLDTSSVDGNVSSNPEIAAKQRALVAKMKSVEGQLKYAQNNAQFPGSRNPDDGSGDCSSTIQWAYKNVTGVDPGSWTGGMRENENTYQVADSTADESKLQLGDIILMNGHVEMYAGNGQMIGHGGGADGKTPGPTTKRLGGTPPYDMIRRLNEFRGSGSGLFVSQLDSKYKSKPIGGETVGEAGCAPAAATMASNLMLTQGEKPLDMNNAIDLARDYATPSGVSADYFIDQFDKRGLSSQLLSGSQTAEQITNNLKGKSGDIVLLGSNETNNSKKKSPFGKGAHYVVATGMSKDGNTIYINDPESDTENIPYQTSQVLPYVYMGIAPTSKGNKKLDQASKKIAKLLAKFRGKGQYDSDSAQYITWNYLRNKGCSEHCAAGIMGNIQQESGFVLDADDGTGADGTGAHGLFQWQGARFTELVEFAQNQGASWASLPIQLEYFWQEFGSLDYWLKAKNTAYSTHEELMQSNNYEEATRAFEEAYERAGIPMMEKRIAYAKEFYEEFTGKTVDTSVLGKEVSSTSSSTSNSENSTTTTKKQTIGEWYNSLVNTITNGTGNITDIYTAFDKLAEYYGLSTASTMTTDNSNSSSASSNNSTSVTNASTTSAVGSTKTASEYLSKFKSWEGADTGSEQHKAIIDAYNDNRPDGAYKMTYSDGWCQAAASAADSSIGDNSVANTAHPPTAVNFYKNNNEWHEPDESGFTPQPGDQIYYSWNKNGYADHVGVVYEKPDGNSMETIQANWSDSVKMYNQDVNADTILGYGRPAFPDNTAGKGSGIVNKAKPKKTPIINKLANKAMSGKGSDILQKLNRFKENPKPISKFKLSGKGTSTPVYNNTELENTITDNKTAKVTPNLSKSYSNISQSNNKIKSEKIDKTVSTNTVNNDTTLKLINIVVQLLTKVVDNTTSIKDIASLLTTLLKSDTKTDSKKDKTLVNTVDSEARALLLKNMRDLNTDNTSLEKLISNVEAILQQ